MKSLTQFKIQYSNLKQMNTYKIERYIININTASFFCIFPFYLFLFLFIYLCFWWEPKNILD